MIDEVIGVGHEADVRGPKDLVEVGVEPIAAEQRSGVGRKVLHLAAVKPYPAFAIARLIPVGDDNRAFVEVFGGKRTRVTPARPRGQRGPTPECLVHLSLFV